MADLSTTKMSSKGQVVIPEDIRKKLNLRAGSQFVVFGKDDVVVLKAISSPSMEDFDNLIAETRRQIKEAGLKRSDIKRAVMRVRTGK
jgi:AbrB family looped-hinge helix DNA binding protein